MVRGLEPTSNRLLHFRFQDQNGYGLSLTCCIQCAEWSLYAHRLRAEWNWTKALVTWGPERLGAGAWPPAQVVFFTLEGEPAWVKKTT